MPSGDLLEDIDRTIKLVVLVFIVAAPSHEHSVQEGVAFRDALVSGVRGHGSTGRVESLRERRPGA